jgi:hypothetical protein
MNLWREMVVKMRENVRERERERESHGDFPSTKSPHPNPNGNIKRLRHDYNSHIK